MVVIIEPGMRVVIDIIMVVVITRVDADGATNGVISFCSQRQWLDISEMEIQNIAKSVQISNLRFMKAYLGLSTECLAAHSLNSRGSSSLRRETSFVKIAGSNPSCYKYRNIYE